MNIDITCKTCNSPLPKYRRTFCSDKCQEKSHNFRHKNYVSQRLRGWTRKALLVKEKGGCCEKCGYSKNISALDFHHIDPSTKKLQLTIRECSNSKLQLLLEEAKKCQLLCRNCHSETHNPDGENWKRFL